MLTARAREEDKVRGLCAPVIDAEQTQELIESVWRFDDLSFLDRVDTAVRAGTETPRSA
jgi:hypothetical protein